MFFNFHYFLSKKGHTIFCTKKIVTTKEGNESKTAKTAFTAHMTPSETLKISRFLIIVMSITNFHREDVNTIVVSQPLTTFTDVKIWQQQKINLTQKQSWLEHQPGNRSSVSLRHFVCCNLFWAAAHPTWWYDPWEFYPKSIFGVFSSELSENRSNIQGTSAYFCESQVINLVEH